MLVIEPGALTFRDVRLNQAYTTSLCITNPLTASVEFTLRPSAPRYIVTPNKVTLQGGQSIVVSVRLFLSHYPNYSKGLRGQEDSIIIKSSYFEQKVDVTFYLHSRDWPAGSGVASRSVSPASRRALVDSSSTGVPSGVSKDAYETILELQNQLRNKDQKIKQMEDVIGQLESHYPSMQEIIRSRVEQERAVFEEKSEKVLKILKRKDETIGLLQAQVDDVTAQLHMQRQAAKDETISNNTGLLSLERSIAELSKKLSDEGRTNASLRERLESSEHTIDSLRAEARHIAGRSRIASGRAEEGSELEGLRERTLDQAEQIEVLVSELAQLRGEKSLFAEIAAERAQEEISRLRQELLSYQQRCSTINEQYTALLATSAQGLAKVGPAAAQPDLYLLASADIDVSNNVSNNTSARAGPATNADLGKIAATISLYEERREKADEERDTLRKQLYNSDRAVEELRERCQELESKWLVADTEGKLLSQRYESLVNEKEEASFKLADKEIQLRSALEKVSDEGGKTGFQDAHLWWSYVWHELKRQAGSGGKDGVSGLLLRTSAEPAGGSSSVAVELHQLNLLKEAVRQQAVEITSLRQEALGSKLSASKELTTLRGHLEDARREVVRVSSQARLHRGDKDLKMAEMAATIKALQMRGDLYPQVAAARQEVETEKMSSHHLRSDVETYRSLLEDEKVKVLALRKELSLVELQLQKDLVLQTLVGVPGIDPATLIEVMGEHVLQLKAEISVSRAAAGHSQAQAVAMQKALSNALRSKEQNSGEEQQEQQHIRRRSSIKLASGESEAVVLPQSMGIVLESMKSVEAGASPQAVVDRLDASLLAQQVLAQEMLVSELRARLADSDEALAAAETARLQEVEAAEGRGRAELEALLRRQEIAQVALDDAKAEARLLRDKCLAMEKQLADATAAVPLVAPVSITAAAPPDADRRERDAELEATKNILRERTTQLKIIMETLDTFQIAGVKSHEGNENFSLENLATADHAYQSLAPTESSWSMQALVKRTVELTMELAGQTATASLEERHSHELERECRKRSKELNGVRATCKRGEEAIAAAQQQAHALSAQLKESERRRLEESRVQQREAAELASSLREAESQAQVLEVTVAELRQRVAVGEAMDFEDWIEGLLAAELRSTQPEEQAVLPADDKDIDSPGGGPRNCEDVRDLVVGLINQWRDQIGTYSSSIKDSASKVEQRFHQRIIDLVLDASDRANRAQAQLQSSALGRERAESSCRVYKRKLSACLQHMLRYRNRAFAAERVVSAGSRHEAVKQDRMVSFLRQALREEREAAAALEHVLTTERRASKQLELRQGADVLRVKKLQLQVAELEARGSASLQGRDEALSSLDGKLRVFEEGLQKFIAMELPRIVSGMPVTEDSLASLMNGDKYAQGAALTTFSLSSGLDRTYALAQALAAAKGQLAMQEMRQAGMHEKQSLLRDKAIALEGVLQKWGSDLETAGAVADLFETSLPLTQTRLSEALEADAREREHVHKLRQRLVELEEENVDLRGRVENTAERSEDLRRLMEEVLREEQASKTKAHAQTSRLKLQLESEHAQELRSTRERYEAEQRRLCDELDRLQLQAEDARLELADAMWRGRHGSGNLAATGSSVGDAVSAAGEASPGATFTVRVPSPLPRAPSPLETKPKRDEKTKKKAAVAPKGKKGGDAPSPPSDSEHEGREQHSAPRRQQSSLVHLSSNSAALEAQQLRMQAQEERIAELARALDAERLHTQEARSEVDELSGLLALQRDNFSKHLHQEKQREDALLAPLPAASAHAFDARLVEQEVLCEDRTLWPSASSLAEELSSLLRSLQARHRALAADGTLRMAVAALARVRCIVTHSEERLLLLPSTPSNEHRTGFGFSGAPDSASSDWQRSLSRAAEYGADSRLPEHSLKELRGRVVDIEQTMSEEVERQKILFETERKNLLRSLQERADEVEQLRRENSGLIESIRSRYEDSLRQSQDALETQTSAASQHVSRLEELLQRSSNDLHTSRGETESLRKRLNEAVAASQQDEVAFLQRQLQHCTEDLEETRAKIKKAVADHHGEVEELHLTFGRYRQSQAETVASLERQLHEQRIASSDAQTQQRRGSSNSVSFADSEASGAMQDDKILQLEERFRTKTSELERALNALSRAGVSSADNSVAHGEESSGMQQQSADSVIAPPSLKASPPSALAPQYSSGSLAAETEIEDLSTLLLRERRMSAELRQQLQRVEAGGDHKEGAKARKAGAVPADHEAVQSNYSRIVEQAESSAGDLYLRETASEFILQGDGRVFVRKMNELRRLARAELLRLRQSLLSAHHDGAKGREEAGRLRADVADMRMQLASLREDNHRKAKLLSSLRSAKTVESSSLEQWKGEAAQLEESTRRLQRAVASKDALIRDLKSRVEAMEETEARRQETPTTGAAAAASEDLAELTMGDLKNRLRLLEAEKARSKVSSKNAKEKIADLEAALAAQREEVERVTKANEQAQALRSSSARKDALNKTLKIQLDRAKAEHDVYHADAELRIGALQRRLAQAERAQTELQREIDFLRQQHAAEEEEEEEGAVAGRPMTVRESMHFRRLSAPEPQPRQARRATGSPPTPLVAQPQIIVPRSLDTSTASDLSDVMAALMLGQK